MRMRAALLAVALVAAGCGDDSTETTSPTSSVPSSTTTAATPTTSEAPTTTAGSTTTSSPSTTTSFVIPGPTVPVADLPGEPIEIFPYVGSVLSVFGVRHDDVLNVRRIPGLEGEIVATLDPLESGFVATGRHQQLPTSLWMEVVVDEAAIGWINQTFVAIEGVTSDDTTIISRRIDDPTAPTLEALGLRVAELFAVDPDVLQRIEMSAAPSVGDLGEVTYDVVGIGDDASVGYRLHVFAVDEAGDGTWTLRTVEVTDMCGRGGEPGGLCV